MLASVALFQAQTRDTLRASNEATKQPNQMIERLLRHSSQLEPSTRHRQHWPVGFASISARGPSHSMKQSALDFFQLPKHRL